MISPYLARDHSSSEVALVIRLFKISITVLWCSGWMPASDMATIKLALSAEATARSAHGRRRHRPLGTGLVQVQTQQFRPMSHDHKDRFRRFPIPVLGRAQFHNEMVTSDRGVMHRLTGVPKA